MSENRRVSRDEPNYVTDRVIAVPLRDTTVFVDRVGDNDFVARRGLQGFWIYQGNRMAHAGPLGEDEARKMVADLNEESARG